MPPTPKKSRKTKVAAGGVAKKKPASATTKKPATTKKREGAATTDEGGERLPLTRARYAQQGQESSDEDAVALPPMTPQQRQEWGPDHRKYTRRCTVTGPLGGEWELVSWTENWVRTRRPT